MFHIPPRVFANAIRDFWRTREAQAQKQKAEGSTDQGARGSVTGGKQMDGFVHVITQLMQSAGVNNSNIHTNTALELPGFYRPVKKWDIVVVSQDQLLAAIELKSHVGPSFGNNFNNRIEEAIGSAVDIWTAFRDGAFQASPAPFIGYLLLLEECNESQRPVKIPEPHFQAFNEFINTGYAKRYEIFCRKLIRERQYCSTCFLTSNRTKANNLDENYEEPAGDLCASNFLIELLKHVSR